MSQDTNSSTHNGTLATLQQAIEHHQAGRLQEAEALYLGILQAQPSHPEANHNQGILMAQMNQPAAGLPFFLAALEADPARGQYWLSYIDALIQAEQLENAREVLAIARRQGLQGSEVEALALRLGSAAPAALHAGSESPRALPAASPSSKNKTKKPSASSRKKDPSSQEINDLLALFNEGRHTEAATLAQAMTLRFPQNWIGWKMLGVLFKQAGRSADALAPMQKAAALSPGDAEMHNNLGIILNDLGRLDEAEAGYRKAIKINPHYAQAHSNLGATLQDMGRLDDAEASYRRALQIDPSYAKAHNNLGANLQEQGRQDEAEACYQRALELRPDYVEALNNRALLLNAQGKSTLALNIVKQSLRVKETDEAKSIFVGCVKRLLFTHDDSEIRAALIRALTEPWCRPSELTRVSSDLVKLNPEIGACLARAVNAWPRRLSAHELFGSNGLATLAADNLLCALLDSAPICDIEMERFLTMARRAMLEAATGMTALNGEAVSALGFYSALARQCFINEYVFSYSDDEINQASALRDSLAEALKTQTQVPALWPVAVAAYFPLHALPLASRFPDRAWPESVTAVLVQQVREPAEELQLRATIPSLTSIEDEVSLRVQNQYEENPYPRWIKPAPAGEAKSIVKYLSQKFPLAPFKRQYENGGTDILIAGCGTGQHPIGTAQRTLGAQVLAVDLSISSLGYAKRKTRELGLASIEYAQADLLKLGSLGRSFDVIESSGVLHHLADPWTGWRVLLSLLRPGGFMKLGFYSELARRNIVRIRAFIADRGYGATANEIRQCRQDLMDLDKSLDFGTTLDSPDFFSISTCRDLLFHVQEHRMVLPDIAAFLSENKLVFLGFEIEGDVLHAYKQRFPDDLPATNLAHWQVFEHENPDTFFGMYQFWIQKIV